MRALLTAVPRPWPGGSYFAEPGLDPQRARRLAPGSPGAGPREPPADVLPAIGWSRFAPGTDWTLSLAAVLRSWEDWFGARLLYAGGLVSWVSRW